MEAKLKEEISGKKSQRIYDNGVSKVAFSQFSRAHNTQTVRLTTNGKVGPDIKEAKRKGSKLKARVTERFSLLLNLSKVLKMSMLNSRHSGLNLFQKISIRLMSSLR